jgi:protein gp37
LSWPANVWLGTSVENQDAADRRIPDLLKCPAALRFLSIEPLLGPIDDIERWLMSCVDCGNKGSSAYALSRDGSHRTLCHDACIKGDESPAIDWVIVGSETGPGARPMDPNWVRSIRDQCQAAGVPFFFKQMMDNGKRVSMPKLDGVVHDAMPKAVQT